MPDWTNLSAPDSALPLFINTGMFLGNGLAMSGIGVTATPASGAWTTANTAVYMPFWLPYAYPVNRLFWSNGSVAGGNSDIGIYTFGGGKVFTAGSTAEAGVSAPQFVTPATPFVLGPGRYFIAYNHSVTTANHVFGWTVTALQARLIGLYGQAVGATALPASATFAQAATTMLPLVGITRTVSGF